MNFKKGWKVLVSLHIQRANLMQQKPYRLAVQNNENNLRDFYAIPEFPAGVHVENF